VQGKGWSVISRLELETEVGVETGNDGSSKIRRDFEKKTYLAIRLEDADTYVSPQHTQRMRPNM
jgi:hypothetical protein